MHVPQDPAFQWYLYASCIKRTRRDDDQLKLESDASMVMKPFWSLVLVEENSNGTAWSGPTTYDVSACGYMNGVQETAKVLPDVKGNKFKTLVPYKPSYVSRPTRARLSFDEEVGNSL
jgi:hypothetical protein